VKCLRVSLPAAAAEEAGNFKLQVLHGSFLEVFIAIFVPPLISGPSEGRRTGLCSFLQVLNAIFVPTYI
jgi:hypothetical protein